VNRFQHEALADLRAHVRANGVVVDDMEQLLLRAQDRARAMLVAGDVPLEDLIVAQRVERGVEERTANTVLRRAMERSSRLGWPVALGSRLRFVEVDDDEDGVVLAAELGVQGLSRPQPDIAVHARRLDRAAWSLLAPFGWRLEPLRRPLGQGRLPVSRT